MGLEVRGRLLCRFDGRGQGGLIEGVAGLGGRLDFGCLLGAAVVAAAFAECAPAVFGRAVEGIGIAAQAEGHGKGKVVGHRQAERPERREAEGDDLRDRHEVRVIARPVGVYGLDCRRTGEADVAAAGAEEHRGEEGDNEVHQNVGGVETGVRARGGCLGWVGESDRRFGHAVRPMVGWRGSTLSCGDLSRNISYRARWFRGGLDACIRREEG